MNGTLLAGHLYGCRSCPLELRQIAWRTCTTLQKTKPRPFEPRASSIPARAGLVGESGGPVDGETSGPPVAVAADRTSTSTLLPYLDRVTNHQADAIEDVIIRFFVSCRVPFLQVESSSFLTMLQALRPGCVARKQVPTRRQKAGPRLDGLHDVTVGRVMRILSLWCQRRMEVLVLDA